MRALMTVLACLVVACGAGSTSSSISTSPSPSDSISPSDSPSPSPSPSPSDSPSPSAPPSLASDLTPEDAPTAPARSLAASLAGCAHPGEDCAIAPTAAWDPAAHAFVVLDVDFSEGGAESAALVRATPTADTALASVTLDRAGLASLRRAVRSFASLAPPANLITEAASRDWSSSTYVPLVALAAPLEGWLLELTTNDDLDHPEHVLRLVRRADEHAIVLGRRDAALVPCDGDGWTCGDGDRDDCSAADLRAEDRLCVEREGIAFVGASPDRDALVVLGTRIVAGDGGYPPHHWVVPLPALE